MSRLSRRSLFRADTLTTLPSSQPGSAADTQQVDDEDERVVALDVDLRVALLAVRVLGRDDQHHAAADLLAGESLDPALDEAGVAERVLRRLALGVGVVEGRVRAPHRP